MEIGESWAYRARAKDWGAAVSRVELVRVGGPRSSGRVHVRFLEGEETGLQEWVAPDCLLAPWADVEVFRADDAAELALAEASREVRGTAAFEAARLVLGFVRPKKSLRLRRTVADAGVLEIVRFEDTAALFGLDLAELSADPMLHKNRNGLCLTGWPVTKRIARHAAEKFADRILPETDNRQQTLEEERARPSWHSWQRRDDRKLDAEQTVLRTVREWCGEERADRYDELVALRAEVLRLGELVERAVRTLRDRGHGVIASTIERDLGTHISSLGPDPLCSASPYALEHP
ncbi:PE-PGRS family protein [Streptomyces sp. 3MP-14]|uniref:PE-PGRS family protein n=1 Tax=Streptomyces mimosae TaxID=2586635 RepID=A0A5N6APN3_9ACTN|nr:MULTISPECIES: PE-PGRS family protein [Streptomyces]KAB8170807.1 PE-PGRS family protein [Streptomyces mimosae]KAB8179840.1 PE-PGRS family protein [Streptomyces sp. 3MP-14]